MLLEHTIGLCGEALLMADVQISPVTPRLIIAIRRHTHYRFSWDVWKPIVSLIKAMPRLASGGSLVFELCTPIALAGIKRERKTWRDGERERGRVGGGSKGERMGRSNYRVLLFWVRGSRGLLFSVTGVDQAACPASSCCLLRSSFRAASPSP